MITAQRVQVTVNNYPAEVREKLEKLLPGQIRRVKLAPHEFFTVNKKLYPHADTEKASWSGQEVRCAEHSIPASGWTINVEVDVLQPDGTIGKERQPFLVGFVERYDTDGSPIFREVSFGKNGILTFNGDNPKDVRDFETIQLYHEMREDPLAPEKDGEKAVRRNWRFYLENVGLESKGDAEKFRTENEIRNKLAVLTQEDINILMGAPAWNRGFCFQTQLVGKGTLDAGVMYLLKIMNGKEGHTRVNKLLKSLMEVKELDLLAAGLKKNLIITLDDQIQRNDGVQLAKLKAPLVGTDSQKAEAILAMYPTNKDWNEKLSKWLRAELKK